MEGREIVYTVAESGRVSPASRQWGGVQYEDNITTVVFDVTAIDSADILWRIDFDSPEAGYDPSEILQFDDGYIRRLIPYKMTRFGGEMQATLVGTHSPDGETVSAVAYSVPVKIYFTEVERHEETDDAAALNVSASEKAAKDAADRAEEAAAFNAEKQDKFAELVHADELSNFLNFLIEHNVYFAVKGSSFQICAEGEETAIVFTSSGENPVVLNNALVFPADAEGNSVISCVADPTGDTDAANKRYVDGLVGDIETALDGVIAIQNALIGGGA